ncbi:30S ribosomal protein S23 [Flavobacterium akiainvivens]|jgi:four helix bundle protein|uniref:30S ribosomal protein S23 n=1 Tax=Flavobacterium akiainvivens TaxID=1202724 RepID=A0A0M8MGV6_9FLAO|nr:four helix bundle protein [Flavobacterium akiainvivens]KOS05328.1 30S ribosomal protein S23 [Flavobacterium akiainvivens]SFQ76601.1 four helix bundle protein [Flavobacterium akiainvivens]
MAKINKFEELQIWQYSRELCRYVEVLFQTTPLGGNYAIRNQIERSSGSIMDNIAEGFERGGNKEFIQFLSISKGSCGEVKSQSYRAFDKKLISEEQHLKLNDQCELVKNKIGAMINYLLNSEMKGLKFK